MAVYEIGGQQYDIPDEVQGDQLIETLTFLSEQQEPEGFAGASVLEPLAAIGSSILAEPAAGIAGLATGLFTQDPAAAAAVVEGVRESLTFQPRTEKGQAGLQAVGETLAPIGEAISSAETTLGDIGAEAFGPVGGAIGATIPTALGEVFGVFGGRALSRIGRVKTEKAQEAIKALDEAERGIITDKGVSDVAEVIQKGSPEDIAAIIDADPNFYRAADELGITTEPLAGFASQNPQFRDVEAALRKVPGSALDPQAIKFIEETSQKADDLIVQYGGTLDKAQLGLDFKEKSLASVDDLLTQTDEVYGSIANLLPKESRHPATETINFLKQKANELGGRNELPPKLKRLFNQLETTTKTTKTKKPFSVTTGGSRTAITEAEIDPTLGSIDQARREIGQALKGSGPFKDVETGLNKALYARLTKDQDAIAQAQGLGEVTESAKGLVRQRKQIEDNLQALLGKDLNKALNVTVSGALKKLSVGEVDKFKAVMNAIPKHQRQEVALSAMNDVFKGTGVGQAGLSPTQFVKWFDTIKRSPAAKKALFDNLPKDSVKAINNLFEVSRGISRSLQQTTPTGRINALFNPETGLIRRMVGSAAGRGIAFATGSPAAAAITDTTMSFLRQANDPAKRASELMSSPKFQNLIRQSVKEGVIDGNKASKALQAAERNLAKSEKFKAWADSLGAADKAALQGGLLIYLFKDLEENKP